VGVCQRWSAVGERSKRKVGARRLFLGPSSLDVEHEQTPLLRYRHDTNLPSHSLGELFGNEQTESASAICRMSCDVGLSETLKNLINLIRSHANTSIRETEGNVHNCFNAPFRVVCDV